jgi:hypothetical protein
VLLSDGLNQQAFFGIARKDCGTRISSVKYRLAAVKPQAPRLFLGPVAFLTPLSEDRPYPGLEKIDGGGGEGLDLWRRCLRVIST